MRDGGGGVEERRGSRQDGGDGVQMVAALLCLRLFHK